MLIGATASATPGEFAVNYDSGQTANAVVLRLGSDFGLVHVVDHYVMRGTSYPLNKLYCFLARRTTCAENFNFLF